jgi:hypothetical protein
MGGVKVKFTFETDDPQEALMYQSAPNFYAALYEIKEFVRGQAKYGYTGGEDVVEFYREKINQIVHDEAPSFHEIV